MFTVEFEPDTSKIVSMDEEGIFDDVEVFIGDDSAVYIRQYDFDMGAYEMVLLSYRQFIQIYAALQSPEGTFILEKHNA
jgi:hypothetical protein